MKLTISKRTGVLFLVLFAALFTLLPIGRHFFAHPLLAMFEVFYRAGSLVFGSGHVVLPLLEREVVPAGWVGDADFLAGYGAVQAVPGPMFTFASYLGMTAYGVVGAVVATAAIFFAGVSARMGGAAILERTAREAPLTRRYSGRKCGGCRNSGRRAV